MMRILSLALATLALVFSSPPPAHAQPSGYQMCFLQDVYGSIQSSRVVDGEITVVAWRTPGGNIVTCACDDGDFYPNVYHAVGQEPVLLETGGAVFLAFVQGNSVRIRCGDGISWSDCGELNTGSGRTPRLPDLGVWGLPAQPCLVWQEESHVLFSMSNGGVWQPPTEVALDAWYEAYPQTEPAWSQGQIWPRIYYLTEDYGSCVSRQFDGAVWLPPVLIGDQCGGPIDVAARTDSSLRHGILCRRPQPPCPCNAILFREELANGTWGPPEDLTVPMGEMDWPLYLGLDATSSDFHAFWYQESYNGNYELTGQRMFSAVRRLGSWDPPTSNFGGFAGVCNDIACVPGTGQQHPSYCWVNRYGGYSELVLMVYIGFSGTTDLPEQAAALEVFPNPSSTLTELRLATRSAAPILLEIFDVSGQRVLRADVQIAAEGSARYGWTGRDERGAIVPAGVYPARLTQGNMVWTRRLVRLP